jgi:K+-sensing histidine kinase KdpD
MDLNEAAISILSKNPDVRLRAARFFAANPHSVSASFLRAALQRETVSWTKKALIKAVEAVEVSVVNQNSDVGAEQSEPSERMVRSIMARAVEDVTSTILHEFGAVIGELKLSASIEFSDFEGSDTNKMVKRLTDLLKAIRNLKRASAKPIYSEFDLPELISEIYAADRKDFADIAVRFAGPETFQIVADRGSLLLAIVNGLRNAREAVANGSRLTPAEIVVNWGKAGNENFLVILDSGPGFTGNPSDALRVGVSSKKSEQNLGGEQHMGYGLATALYAMRAMEGELLVSNSLEGGAIFELRWYRDYENTTG